MIGSNKYLWAKAITFQIKIKDEELERFKNDLDNLCKKYSNYFYYKFKEYEDDGRTEK